MVLDGIISTIVGGCAPTQATEMVQEVNSVNPKPFRHGNTEPNSEKSDKCVETKCFLSLMDKDIVRAYGKPYELPRNEAIAHKGSNKTDHRLCPHGNSSLPPILVIRLVQPANSVNPKLFEHGNTELNSQQCDKSVENINGRTQVVQDMFRTLWKRSEPTGNELVARKGGNRLRLHSIHEHLWDDHNGHPGVGLHPHAFPYRDPLWRGQDDHR